ncbi:MAG TPA: DUF1800 domain-containing protein [Candidatus Binatia bacterium]|nr:DUF1800 domain-containing protein [Candidatus Binatia bacterium]
MVTWNEENVVHLLSRAGFGAKPQEISGWVKRGQALSVNLLCFQKGATSKPPGKSNDSTQAGLESIETWWFKRMATANTRRLQEKMCLFWHDHFASSFDVVKNALWMSLQNRVFRLHGLGSFKTLVFEVTRDPAMLEFLDGKTNTKNRPNENYGRELQELFVLGVTDLNGTENYTQNDVVQLARCLTGWQIVSDEGVFTPSRFDGGNKTLFSGKSYQVGPANIGLVDSSGALLPGPQNLIDALFGHRDSDGERTMPRFLAKKLWEYFAYPNPSKALLDEIVVPFVGAGNPDTDFVISNLLQAIFLHDEFYSDQAKSSTVKNPVEYAASAMRALRVTSNYKPIPEHLLAMGMELFNPPSVNGWNQGLAWLSSGQLLSRFAFGQAIAAGRITSTDGFKLVPKQSFDDSSTSADAVVDQLLAKLHVADAVPPGARQALIDYFEGATNFKDPAVVEKKVRGAIALMLELPEFQLH